MATTMTDAFKKLFLGLGGDRKELAENNDVGDYIKDLESAIKSYVDAQSTPEFPAVTTDDNGKIMAVVGGEWTLVTMTATADTSTGAVTFTFTPDTPAE